MTNFFKKTIFNVKKKIINKSFLQIIPEELFTTKTNLFKKRLNILQVNISKKNFIINNNKIYFTNEILINQSIINIFKLITNYLIELLQQKRILVNNKTYILIIEDIEELFRQSNFHNFNIVFDIINEIVKLYQRINTFSNKSFTTTKIFIDLSVYLELEIKKYYSFLNQPKNIEFGYNQTIKQLKMF